MSNAQLNEYLDPTVPLPPALEARPLACREFWRLVLRLQQARGWSFAGQDFLADHVGVNGRTIRRYIRTLVADGFLSIRHRRGGPALMRVRIPLRPDTSVLPPGQECPTRVGHKCPTNRTLNTYKPYPDTRHPKPPSAAFDPADAPLYAPAAWNAWADCSGKNPVDAFMAAFEARKVSQIQREGMRWWTIVSATRLDANRLQLTLIDDDHPGRRDGSATTTLLVYGGQVVERQWRA